LNSLLKEFGYDKLIKSRKKQPIIQTSSNIHDIKNSKIKNIDRLKGGRDTCHSNSEEDNVSEVIDEVLNRY